MCQGVRECLLLGRKRLLLGRKRLFHGYKHLIHELEHLLLGRERLLLGHKCVDLFNTLKITRTLTTHVDDYSVWKWQIGTFSSLCFVDELTLTSLSIKLLYCSKSKCITIMSYINLVHCILIFIGRKEGYSKLFTKFAINNSSKSDNPHLFFCTL